MSNLHKDTDDVVRCTECGDTICEGETARCYRGDWLCEDCKFVEARKYEKEYL